MTDADEWLAGLPTALERQRALIGGLLGIARSDDRVRLLVVGCSIGRGAADELSDVDALLEVRPDSWNAVIGESRSWMWKLGQVVDMWQTVMPGARPELSEWQHTFALFASGVELDLSIGRALAKETRPRDWMVLHDPDGAVGTAHRSREATSTELWNWTYRILTRLSAVSKYVQRGALWEALNCLELARADVWRVWCVAASVADPQYGVTAAFDDPRKPVPPELTRTIADLDATSLRDAAVRSLDIFTAMWQQAAARVGEPAAVIPPLAAVTRERLRRAAS